MEFDGTLRHLAFFEELAKLDESDPSWRSVSAGLVMMRLVDNWLTGDSRSVAVDSWAVNAVRGAIEEVPETTPLRRILAAIVDTMTAAHGVEVQTLCPRLIAYGQALEYDAKWSLAIDVYQTVAQNADAQADADLVVTALIRLAVCHKNVGDLEAAARSYDQASVVALAAGDMIGVLNARLGDATIAMARGNMPKAESILEETLEKAQSAGFDEIRTRALSHRAFIAGSGGRHEEGIRFSYDALELSKTQRDRDRSLMNIATGFRYLGLLDVARDAYLVLAATAQEQYIRWMSELNLMELAAHQGMELDFDKYRRDLVAADFTPQLRITYLLHVGRGYSSLGHADAGIPYLERAIQMASDFKLNQLLFEAEAALGEARRRETRRPAPAANAVDESIHAVIDAIHSMKETAGIT